MNLKHQIKRRFAQIESNYTLAAPTILDPRFKVVSFYGLESVEQTVYPYVCGIYVCGLFSNSKEPSTSTQTVAEPGREMWCTFDGTVAKVFSCRPTTS